LQRWRLFLWASLTWTARAIFTHNAIWRRRDCHDYYTDPCGTVFKLAKNGAETALYSSAQKQIADGLQPRIA